MDKLTAMRTFVAVVRLGSFSAAATSMAAPKTRISQRVQELEAVLSTRLLYRTTRVISLTEEGRIYFDKCVQILEEIDRTELALGRLSDQPEGRLRVSCMSLIARSVILPQIDDFLSKYPQVSVKLSVSDKIVNLNEDGYDCAIRGGKLESSTLISRHIRTVSFGMYAAPKWVERNHPIVVPDDLARLDLIKLLSQRDGAIRHWELVGPGEARGEESQPRLEIDDDQAGIEAALGGAGIALCPDFVASPHVLLNRLVRILPEWSSPQRPIYAIYPTRRHISAKLRCFLDWAEAMIRQA